VSQTDGSMNRDLLAEARALREQFEQTVMPHRDALWRYCRMLTGSPWDGEDLFQETMLKAFASLAQLWQPLVPKTYLFRIASNTWIDQCRRKRAPVGLADDEDVPAPEEVDKLEVEEAILKLIACLPTKQAVVFFLMDVFGFSAAEVAGMVHMTESSAYTTLHRARKRLRALQSEGLLETGESAAALAPDQERARKEALAQFAHALNTGDPSGIIRFMSETMHNDAAPGFQEYGKRDMLQGSMRGFGHGALHAVVQTLWGKEAVIVYARTDSGPQLHNISLLEVDNGEWVLQKSYYFCREFLEEAAKALQVPLQLDKPAVRWG